jgi:hypothetical protein
MACASGWAAASQVWAEVGDGRFRSDVELLADSGIIDLPLDDWPIPIADIARVMDKVNPEKLKAPALRAAYDRIENTIRPANADYLHLDSVALAAGHSSLLRDYDTPAREDGDLSAEVVDYGYRWAAELNFTYAVDPRDGQPFRMDGSNITARFGNWLLSLNTLDKWWGPSYETSLILSDNARPMPAIELDRATSAPLDVPILRWLGPWRFMMFFATGAEHRPDVDNSFFYGTRLSWRPLKFLEVGAELTTQWCGHFANPVAEEVSHRDCDLTMLKNVLVGNDTTQYAGVTGAKPGHAEAGYEARLNSPWHLVPLALYTQIIGNDEIHRLPARLMKQEGIESWLNLANGDTIKGFAEYSDSTCGAERSGPGSIGIAPGVGPQYGCAYVNSVFFAGYTYRGLNIGDSAGPDAILRTVGLRWDRAGGDEWQLKIQSGHFDRGDLVNLYEGLPYDPVSPYGSSIYDSAQVEYRRPFFGGTLFVQLGAERQEPAEVIGNGRGFGYVTWSKAL